MRDVFAGRILRLAFGFATVVAIITAAAFAFVYFQAARDETSRVGVILKEELRANLTASDDRLRVALVARQTPDIRRIDYLALFDADRKLVLGNLSAFPDVLVDGLPHYLNEGGMRGVATPPTPTIIVAGRRPDGGILVLGRTLLDAYEVESTLWRALSLALLPTIVLYVAIGLFFARKAAQRLDGVHDAITCIMEGDFASRLPVSRDGDEIDRIAAAVNRMLDEIARLLVQLKNAGDNIAHELRSPLAVIRAKLEKALEGDCGAERPRIETALDQVDRCTRTVSAMLRIADVRNGRYKERFRAVDLAAICTEAVEFYELLAEAKDVSLTCSANAAAWVQGDEDLLREAASILIDNAIKFTPPGGAISVAVCLRNGAPRVDVQDSGPGVALADRLRVFQRFYRAQANADEAGYGLGLSIAQAIAELHGLEVRVEDSSQGALFVLAPHPNL